MTNKINGIDVSKCEHHYTNPVNGIIYHGCAIYEQKNELGYWQDTLCEENPNCYFKQLKRLQEENEELKKKKDEYYLRTLDYEAKISYLIQVLEEIRDILCKGRTFYEGYFDNPNLSRTDEAIKLINEVFSNE